MLFKRCLPEDLIEIKDSCVYTHHQVSKPDVERGFKIYNSEEKIVRDAENKVFGEKSKKELEERMQLIATAMQVKK